MKKTLTYLCAAIAMLTLQMCAPSLPDTARRVGEQPKITPDYADLHIPANIAPLNFCIDEKGDKFITRFYTAKGDELISAGKVLDTDVKAWHKLLAQAKGDTVYAEVYVCDKGFWRCHAPIRYVVADDIDPYISYRHIEPLYVNYETLRICQRHLEDFDIDDIYNNSAFLDIEGGKQCMNCHSYQDYNRGGKMQMHIRVNHGGTLIVDNGKVKKVNLKVGDIFSAGAYPSWHPTLPLIAYSINETWQHFHSANTNKVEVQDAVSGLILYDVANNEVRLVQDLPTELETFPYWSADGQWMYFESANIPDMSKDEMANYRQTNYQDIQYNIYRRKLDPATLSFGPVDTVFMASEIGMSATFPRESPDGSKMVFTMGKYGTFHNFHHDADLYMMDMATGKVRPIDEINSLDVDSYHSWSSNGKWLIFSTRRDNGMYTRLYLTHYKPDGTFTKPFMVPERSPFANNLLFQSYNVPEFMACPVSISRQQWLDAVNSDPIDAKYVAVGDL